jgi:hypothetical protein
MTRSIWSIIVAVAILGVAGVPEAGARQLTFFAVMTGGQVVPPSPSNAMGMAYVTLDDRTKRVCYSITYSPLQGVETEAHLHGAPTGETNAVLYDMPPLGTPKVNCVGPIKPAEEKLLKKGRMYINIHTDLYVAGEIRGQVLPVPSAR